MRPDIDIGDMDDVEPRQPEALQAVLDRAQDAVIGIIEFRREGQDAAIEPAIGGGIRPQQTADLGGEHELVTLVMTQHGADAVLAQPVAIERRGIEEPDTGGKSAGDGARRVGLAQRGEKIAERRPAKADLADAQAGAAEPSRVGRLHATRSTAISASRASIAARDGSAAIAPWPVQARAPAITPPRAAPTISPVSAGRVAKTPLKASPAPVVSRGSMRGAAMRVSVPAGSATSTPSAPSVVTTAQPCSRTIWRAMVSGRSSMAPPARRTASSRFGVSMSRQRHSASGIVASAGAGLRMVIALPALAMRKAASVAATDTSS